MIQATITATNPNETEFIGIYEGTQNKIDYTENEEGISLDSYTLDENAVVGGVVWKPVSLDVFKEFYEVNDYGSVRTLHNDKGQYHRLMKQREDKDGYLRYIFRVNGYTKHPHAHRLVALSFISNPNNYDQIDHIDGNKKNNNVSNLRWCTAKENINNPITLKKRQLTVSINKETEKWKKSHYRGIMKTALIRAHHLVCIETGKWYVSARVASKEIGINFALILRYCQEYQTNAEKYLASERKYGYHFRYATEEENALNIPIYKEALLKSLDE